MLYYSITLEIELLQKTEELYFWRLQLMMMKRIYKPI